MLRFHELECLPLSSFFSGKSIICKQGQSLPERVESRPNLKILDWPKKLGRNKRSSLFCRASMTKEKKFLIIDTWISDALRDSCRWWDWAIGAFDPLAPALVEVTSDKLSSFWSASPYRFWTVSNSIFRAEWRLRSCTQKFENLFYLSLTKEPKKRVHLSLSNISTLF